MDNLSPPAAGTAPGPLAPVPLPSPGPARTGRRARHGSIAARALRWLPAALVAAATVAVLGRYGVAGTDLAAFAGYLVLGVTLPGILVVRALYDRPRTLAEEVALGLALGYCVEILLYIGARAAGAPLLVAAWPLVTYAAFLLAPALRRHWRSPGRTRAPRWWPWCLALGVGFLVAWSAVRFFATHALAWPALGTAAPDMAFHLALVGEVKHHMPPSVPMVAGEPLSYHWFVYAHLAAASQLTGIEPLVLLFRLGMLPMLAALVVLAGMTGRRVTGSWAGGALTVAGAVLAGAPSLYLGANGLFTWGGIPDSAWISPTQTLGALLFAPVVLVLVDLLDGRGDGPRAWVLVTILLVALTGAKATYLPLLAAGLVAVAVAQAVRRRRPSRPVVVALGLTAGCLLFAQTVLFGGARQGLVVDPFSFARVAWGEVTGTGLPSTSAVPGLAWVYLLCWVVAWSGAAGLLTGPRRPAVILMLGVGGAGLGAAIVFGHPGRSQLFFLWAGYPYLAAVTAYGLLLLRRWARLSPRATAGAVAAGLAAAYAIPLLCGVTIPLGPGQDVSRLHLPYLVLVCATVAAGALLALLRGARTAAAVLAVALAAIGLPAYGHARVLSVLDGSSASGARPGRGPVAQQVIPGGALAAGRWLRDHSDPDDLVATNAHCRWGRENPCDSRFPWVAALSERRVLVEGWAYTAANLRHWRPGLAPESLPFWDGELLRANDEAFQRPSAAAMRVLSDRHGVRWLFAEERGGASLDRIGDFAALRFRSGGYAVYQLPGDPT